MPTIEARRTQSQEARSVRDANHAANKRIFTGRWNNKWYPAGIREGEDSGEQTDSQFEEKIRRFNDFVQKGRALVEDGAIEQLTAMDQSSNARRCIIGYGS